MGFKMVGTAVAGFVFFGVLLFLPAGTFNYWQAWLFIAVFAVSTWIPSIYLLRTNPAALDRRMRAGPAAETRTLQKIVITVESGQELVSTGVYGIVRHPMYLGNVVLMVGIPLALGSYWGLLFVIPGVVVLAVRVVDEERVLEQELAGYREYTQNVHYRLVPYVW